LEFAVVIFIVFVAAMIVLGVHQAAKRRKALSTWANAHELSFDADKNFSFDKRFEAFDCLCKGSDRYGHNIMRGDWHGRQMEAFDYHYETSSTNSKGGSSTTDHHFSAVILASEMPLKPLFIRPEGFFDKITEFFGYDDIDFESAEFSRTFYVKAPEKRWAYDVIHPRTMEFLLAGPRLTIQFDRHHVIAADTSRFSPAEFQRAADVIAGILDRLPEYVIRDRSGIDGKGRA